MTDTAKTAYDWAVKSIGCPYVMGGTGQICTVSYRQARAAQYPAYAGKIAANCPRMSGKAATCADCRYRGKRAYDCAQLTRFCMQAAGISLVSGSNSQWLKTIWARRGPISEMPKKKLCLVFRQDGNKMGHAGIYLGDGTVVHAKGHAYGVVRETITEKLFTHYGIPKELEQQDEDRPDDAKRLFDALRAALDELEKRWCETHAAG